MPNKQRSTYDTIQLSSTHAQSILELGIAYLGHFTEGSALFSEVNNDTTAAILRLLDCLFDTEYEIRATCADIGSKHVATIALRYG